MEASRDHGKSFIFSYGWPLYCCQKVKPGSRDIENIALVSYSEDQAKKNLVRIRKAIETRPALKWLMPKSKAYVWESSQLNMSNECTIETFGFGSSMRGGHFTRIIIDDPTKDHWTISVQEQENFFFGVIGPALRRGGQLVVSGNPVDKQDLLSVLEANSEYPVFMYPVLNEKKEPLWPERYPLEEIEIRRRSMPAHIFSREYMLKRVSPNDAKFKEEWIHYYRPDDLNGKQLYKVMTIDPAISPGGDALACVVTGTDVKANTYVLDRFSHRGDFKSGITKLCDMMVNFSPDCIGFENFSFQRMYKVWLEEEMNRRGIHFGIIELGRDSSKSKSMRIEALQPKLASGRLFFRQEHRPLIDQLLLWDPLSKSNDDDEIDALAWQVKLWRSAIDESGYVAYEAAKPGTFQEAFEEMGRREVHGIWKLFEDLRGQIH